MLDMSTEMKITKRQLRRIIKEEKARILTEQQGGTRALGLYADEAQVDAIRTAFSDMLNKVNEEAFADLGDNEDAEDMVRFAMLEIMSQVAQSMGYNDVSMSLERLSHENF
jgi:hypothetical protein